jgi:hypothetical protein
MRTGTCWQWMLRTLAMTVHAPPVASRDFGMELGAIAF